MREIVKKIMEVVGNENVILVGKGEYDGINVIQPEEIELYPRKYKNIIVDNIDQLDEKTIKKMADIADSLWVPFSIDKLIKKVDITIENMIEKKEFKDININEKIEFLRKLTGGNASIANFNLPEMAVVISKEREKSLAEGAKIKPFSSFFINLSMVEYLKSKLEEVKKEREKLEIELKNSRTQVSDWEKAMRNERKMRKKMEKNYRKEVVRFFKENEYLNEEMKKKDQEIRKIEMDYQKEIEKIGEEMKKKDQEIKKMGEEMEKIVFEMGMKLEEELERRKLQKRDLT